MQFQFVFSFSSHFSSSLRRYWRQRANERFDDCASKMQPGAITDQRQGWKTPRGPRRDLLVAHRALLLHNVEVVHCWVILE